MNPGDERSWTRRLGRFGHRANLVVLFLAGGAICQAAGTTPAFTIDVDIGGLTILHFEDGRLTGSYTAVDEPDGTAETHALDLQVPPAIEATLWNRFAASEPPELEHWRERDGLGRLLYMVTVVGRSASLRSADDLTALRVALQPVLEAHGVPVEAVFAPSPVLSSDSHGPAEWFDLMAVDWPPSQARVLARDQVTGVVSLEITEAEPATTSPNEPFRRWWVLPGFERPQQPTAALTRRRFGAVTPLGTFALTVDEYAWARRGGDGIEGALALFVFNPRRRGPLECPLPDLFATAQNHGLLTREQESILLECERDLIGRGYSRLLRAWASFSRGPATPETGLRARTELVRALMSLYPVTPEPAAFFDPDQREQLRTLGHDHELPGKCRWSFHNRRLTIELEGCPRSQVVATWNRDQGLERIGPPPTLPHLAVGPADGHQEVTMHLEIDGLDRDAAFRVLLAALAEKGFVTTAPPRPSRSSRE